MNFELYGELEHLGIRLDGLTNMSEMISDLAQEGPNEVSTYKDSMTLLSFLMKDFQEQYHDIMERIPKKAGAAHV